MATNILQFRFTFFNLKVSNEMVTLIRVIENSQLESLIWKNVQKIR